MMKTGGRNIDIKTFEFDHRENHLIQYNQEFKNFLQSDMFKIYIFDDSVPLSQEDEDQVGFVQYYLFILKIKEFL